MVLSISLLEIMRLTSLAAALIFIILVSTLNVPFCARAIAPAFPSSYINKIYGGTDVEYVYSVAETDDGGFVLAGTTEPPDTGKADLWIVKTDVNCVEQWTKTYGNSNDERGGYVVATSDGGFALAGFIIYDADAKQSEIWLIKIDADGNTRWNRTYGVSGLNRVFSLIQTFDGGYALAGSKYPSKGGSGDFFLIKIDANGFEQWSQTYGGAYWDEARSVIETADGGFALTGYTYSYGANASISSDFWLVKTDKSGELEWSQTYGGQGMDEASSVVQTVDGSYAVAGYTYSSDAENDDFWLVKTDSTGRRQWSKTYGGENADVCHSMVATNEGGFALLGSTGSFGVEYFGFWLLVTDESGVELRSEIYRRSGYEEARSLIQTQESKYVLAGSTYSSSDPNCTDFWLVKTDSAPVASPTSTQELNQNSQESYGSLQSAFEWNRQLEWSRTYDGLFGNSIIQSESRGFTITGAAESADEAVLLSLDSSGNELWRKNLPGNRYGNPVKFVAQMDDGGYVTLLNSYRGDCFLVKVDDQGSLQWNKTLISSPFFDEFLGVQTEDGGFAVSGGDSSTFQIVKTDQNGDIEWSQTYEFLAFGRRVLIQTRDGGFLIGGEGHVAEPSSGYSQFVLWKFDSAGNSQWAKEYMDDGVVISVAECEEGGYIFVGHESKGSSDQVWFVKVDSQGNMQWSRSATHSEDFANSYLSSVVQTRGGDFIAAGQWARSFAWVVKVSSSGELLWSLVYGGVEGGEVFASAIIETAEGGFAFTGSGPNGEIWVAKIGIVPNDYRDVVGVLCTEWSMTYGPLDGFSVIQTSDGGYALGGQNATLGPYIQGSGRHYENQTALLIKVNSAGEEEWRRTYESISFDSIEHLVQTVDSGYALMGYSDKLIEGQRVFMLAKTDSTGNIEWHNSHQGQAFLRLTSAIQTADGGFVMAGWEELSSGVCRAQLFKIDNSGNLQWSRSFEKDLGNDPYIIEEDDGLVLTYRLEGVAGLEKMDAQGDVQWMMSYPDAWLTPFCLAKSKDGGYLLGGTREVKSPFQALPWIVKTDAYGNVEWQKAIVMDSRSTLEQAPGCFTEALSTDDGGFILLSGNSASTYWIVKIDSSGNVNWSQRLLGLTPVEYSAHSVFICNDNGLILAGQALPQGGDERFVWIEKFAAVNLPEYPSLSSDSLLIFLIFVAILVAIASLILTIFFLKRR
jgi:hypothetical protein